MATDLHRLTNAMASFMPHGTCFLWRADLLTLHVVSDSLVAASYFCIPILLLTFVRRRPGLHRLGWFFSTFIVACGLTHVLDVWTIWHADYWLAGTLKAVAAAASLATVGALLPLMPYARALSRFGDLDRLNRELESQYRLIVETSNDGIWLVDLNTRTTFVNARLAEMLGVSATAMIGQRIETFVASESRDTLARALAAVKAGQIAGAFDACFGRSDGSSLWTETSLRTIRDADGTATGMIAVIADATERRRAQTALAESERQYRMLAEAMPHAVYTADPMGTIDYCNRTWYDYTGLTEAQTYGGHWVSIVHPDDLERSGAAWSRATKTGNHFEVQLRLRRTSDGMYRWFVSRALPVRDEHGAILRWIGSAADIHDFKIASETRSVLDTLGHMVSIDNEDGSLEYISPSWLEFTGTPESYLHGLATVHPDDRARVEELDRASRDVPLRVQQIELRVRSADGTYRWFLARTVALPESPGSAQRRMSALTDIDDLKRAQEAFGQSERRYRALTDAMPQMVWILDAREQLEYVNERWSNYTGLALNGAQPRSSGSIVHPDDRALLEAQHDGLRARRDFECEVRIRRHDDAYRWHLLRAVPLGDTAGAAAKWIVTATDIEARKAVEDELAASARELAYRADHDPLTGLPNRTKLTERLRAMIEEARTSGLLVAVIYLDIDHFKTVNDSLGHNSGDALLIETATRIKGNLRTEDVASRFGGDEFVVVCHAEDIVDAAQIAERLGAAVRIPIQLETKRVVVASSIGIGLFPHDGELPSELIQKADAAMYAAKQSGRNAWCFYSDQKHLPATASLDMELELREAIARDQFVVHYQPIIDVASGRAIGAEALVRWQHPERGLLSPGEFIAFAEEHGLIADIGELVLDTACAQLRRMKLRSNDAFCIAVNVSARQFSKPGFVGTIASTIAAHGIDARRLEIEITESVVMSDTDAVLATLGQLQALGVRLSLDDFGTGYSSLAYIKNFPIHTLKIDRSFVRDIAVSFTDRAIAKTIVTLAHSLGMRTIAEGVETGEQLEALRTFGADGFQGFLVSRPLPAEQFGEFVAGRRSALRAK